MNIYNLGEEGHWIWSHSDQKINETFWGFNYPNLTNGNTDDCGVMVIEPLQFWWEDTSCLTTTVHEKKVAPVCHMDRVCPGGWEPFGGHCYQYSSTIETWSDAEDDCKSKGGHLASIHSEAERVFIYNLSGKNYTFVGGSDLAIEASLIIFSFYHIHTTSIKGTVA